MQWQRENVEWPKCAGLAVGLMTVILSLCLAAGAAAAEPPPVSLELDGESGYVEIPASDALAVESFTVTAWFRAGEDVSDHRTMLSRESEDAHTDRTWWINLWDGTGELSARTSSGGDDAWLDSDVAVNDEEWHHLAFVMDDDASMAYLYLDGDLIYDQSGVGTPHTPDAPTGIGCQIRGGDPNRFYLGQVAEHRVYNRPLDESEVSSDMEGEVLDGVAGHWPLNEGTGGTANDLSGNDNHGVIIGGADWVVPFVEMVPSTRVTVTPGGDAELGPVLVHEEFEDEVEFQWYFEDEPLEGEIDAGLLLDDVTEDNAGTYTVVLDHHDLGVPQEFEIELSVREVHAPAAGLAGLTAAGGAIALMGLARIRRKRH